MKVDVVIVTYNRIVKLKKTLNCYDTLSVKPRNIIIVNNNCSDGTKEYLDEWRKTPAAFSKFILNLEENIGGSGGFYEGQKYALNLNPDWIMLADDDAYPTSDFFAVFENFVSTHNTEDISAICSSVLKKDDSIDTSHRCQYHLKNGLFYERMCSNIDDYNKDWFKIDLLSYVGCFIKKESLNKAGLVNPDYFIYCDDTEHSIRLKKQGKIICVPDIKIIHDDQNVHDPEILTWKSYYTFRNEIDMLKRHHPLAAIAWTRRQLKLWKHNPKKLAVYKIALKDAWMGRLGMHKKYKPGWVDCKESD